eukprot:5685824-Pleurochrysis_carterae.AAC.6
MRRSSRGCNFDLFEFGERSANAQLLSLASLALQATAGSTAVFANAQQHCVFAGSAISVLRVATTAAKLTSVYSGAACRTRVSSSCATERPSRCRPTCSLHRLCP